MKLHTIIISKRIAKTPKQALSIAVKNGYVSGAIKETNHSFRIEQANRDDFEDDSFKTEVISPYVSLVHGETK